IKCPRNNNACQSVSGFFCRRCCIVVIADNKQPCVGQSLADTPVAVRGTFTKCQGLACSKRFWSRILSGQAQATEKCFSGLLVTSASTFFCTDSLSWA